MKKNPTPEPTISVAMIVKDEAENLPECFRHVSQFCDEIIVVDTGSTDGTAALAEKHKKVKLYRSAHFDALTKPAHFRFNVARNEAIAHCTGDWIVWWDADDRLVGKTAGVIKKLAQDRSKDPLLGHAPVEAVYQFKVQCGEVTYNQPRMFPREKGVVFHPHHSCYEHLISQQIAIRECPSAVISHPVHDGNGHALQHSLILEEDYHGRGVHDAHTTFHLANAYCECGRDAAALAMYGEYLGLATWREERMFARVSRGHCFRRSGKLTLARSEALQAIGEDDRFAEPYCLLGDLYARSGKLAYAIIWYQIACRLGVPANAALPVTPELYDAYPKKRIAELTKQLEAQQAKQEPPNE